MIENVIRSPLERGSITLCGRMFNLPLYRHRVFETSHMIFAPAHQNHPKNACLLSGTKARNREYMRRRAEIPEHLKIYGVYGNGPRKSEMQRAMGINWMTCREMCQAIPPTYSQYIGAQLMPIVFQKTKRGAA